MRLNNSSAKHKYPPCHENHPPLVIKKDGVDYRVYGGSCHSPAVLDLDVLVGLDGGFRAGRAGYPWEKGTSFLFNIMDMSVPSDVDDFKNLIEFLSDSILCGKKVFVGCIGGHGRTGLVLSALVTYMTGAKDSISYVRENYCKKAVESQKQIDWLNKYFGITKVAPTKVTKTASIGFKGYDKYNNYLTDDYFVTKKGNTKIYHPIESELSIHGLNQRR